MNESAGDRFSELLPNALDLTDTDDLDTTEDPDSDGETRLESPREGLPSSFRMRHDAHYVDELMSRTPFVPLERERIPRSVASATPVPVRPDPPAPRDAPAHASRSVSAANLALIASRLERAVSHADGIRADQGTSALLAHSVRVEFARIARLARAAARLENREPPIRRSVTASHLADRVKRVCAPVARLAGLECQVTLGDPSFTFLAEFGLVVLAVAGTVDALVDLSLADTWRTSSDDEEGSAARISIALHSVKSRPALIVDVTCPALFIGEGHADRFFDNTVEDHRTAPAAGVLLAAAAHVARAHGGRADIKRHNGVGVTISYVFPQAIAEPTTT